MAARKALSRPTKSGGKYKRRLVVARPDLGIGFRPQLGRRFAGGRLVGGKVQFEQLRPGGIAEQPPRELPILEQRRQIGEVLGAPTTSTRVGWSCMNCETWNRLIPISG